MVNSRKRGKPKNSPDLPGDVRSLIDRKLRHLRREQDKQMAVQIQVVWKKLSENILKDISARRLGRALNSTPLVAYRGIVAEASKVTEEWPALVWITTLAVLDKANHPPCDSKELNSIIDEHAWVIGQEPFTLHRISPDAFRTNIDIYAQRLGMRIPESFDRGLALAAGGSQCAILNLARQARAGVGIAIDEYLVAQNHTLSINTSSSRPSNTVVREMRKQKTQAMYKAWQSAYRRLKMKRPGMSDVWYAQQIAKESIAQDRDAETIRKNMKK